MNDLLNIENPTVIKQSLGKQICAQTKDNKTYEGNLYVIDPESGAVVLVNENKTFVFPRHALKSLHIISDDVTNVTLSNEDSEIDATTLQEKKEALKNWLTLNLIDIVEDGDVLKYHDYLYIEPPYDITHCYCNNTIVLERIKDLFEKMPNKNDF